MKMTHLITSFCRQTLKKPFKAIFLSIINFLFLPSFFFPQNFKNLVVQPTADSFFTQQECEYILQLPGIEPSSVLSDLMEYPSGGRFISSKKDEYVDENGTLGTELHFWFIFTEPGEKTIAPLMLRIGKRVYGIPFKTVTVHENPSLLSPVLSVEFENPEYNKPEFSVKIGDVLHFTVYIQYCVQMIGYKWILPKDSICKEIEQFEITTGKSRNPDFTTEKFPVATFEWKPLVSGTFSVPLVIIDAIAYNGERHQVSLPNYTIDVLQATKTETEEKAENSFVFEDAFKPAPEPEILIVPPQKTPISAFYCEALAKRHSAERNSFPWNRKVRKQRKDAEQAVGISCPVREQSIPLFILCSCITGVLLITCFVFAALHHYRLMVAFICLFFTAAVNTLMQAPELFSTYGIVAEGKLYPVPEESAVSSAAIVSGQRVKIVERAADWVYIESQELNGWIKARSVYLIR